MTDRHQSDELAQLRAELAAQRAVTDALRARVARPRFRLVRRFLPAGMLLLLLTLMPLATFAANPFTDLDPAQDGGHNPNIDLIFNAGITQGCGSPTAYCPKDNVTREQMASFLARTAGLGSNPPVVNAAQLDGSPSSAFVRTSAAFKHTATGPNTSGHITTLDNPLTNGKPDALLFVTQNWDPNEVYNTHEIGVYYYDSKWRIFNQDKVAMPSGASFNVLVVQP